MLVSSTLIWAIRISIWTQIEMMAIRKVNMLIACAIGIPSIVDFVVMMTPFVYEEYYP